MDRTLRAALVAAAIGLVAVGGIAVFLGIDVAPSVIAGVVTALLFGSLILAAGRRSDRFDDRPPTRPMPRHPGEPPTDDDVDREG